MRHPWLRALWTRAQAASLRAAVTEQALDGLCSRLAAIAPDLSAQYTMFQVDGPSLTLKVRAQHAFQIALALEAIDRASRDGDEETRPLIVDVGDSAGTHLTYLTTLLAADPRHRDRGIDCVSVNVDTVAVAKIRARGMRAELGRAEALPDAGLGPAMLCLAFELLEHLPDPVTFLDGLSRHAAARYLVVTVPWVRRSRVGLHHIRQGRPRAVSPESTHLFELCPEDWRLVFRHAGWQPVEERVYRQYPRRSAWRITAPAWRRLDFEGFYGAILRPDRTWADCFQA